MTTFPIFKSQNPYLVALSSLGPYKEQRHRVARRPAALGVSSSAQNRAKGTWGFFNEGFLVIRILILRTYMYHHILSTYC